MPSAADSVPDFSIIISAWNDARWLPSCIEAIVKQTHTDFEVLIADDCSTDDTAEILRTISDPRFRIVFHTGARTGFVDTLNKLAGMARGRYIKLLCPDDPLLPDYLAAVHAFALQYPQCGLISTGSAAIDERGSVLPSKLRTNLPAKPVLSPLEADQFGIEHGDVTPTSGMAIRADVWRHLGGVSDVRRNNPLKIPNVQDADLASRIQEFYDFGYIPGTHVLIRMHDGQLGGNMDAWIGRVEGQLAIFTRLTDRLVKAGVYTRQQAQAALLGQVVAGPMSTVKGMLRHGRVVNVCAVLKEISYVVPVRLVIWATIKDAGGRRLQR